MAIKKILAVLVFVLGLTLGFLPHKVLGALPPADVGGVCCDYTEILGGAPTLMKPCKENLVCQGSTPKINPAGGANGCEEDGQCVAIPQANPPASPTGNNPPAQPAVSATQPAAASVPKDPVDWKSLCDAYCPYMESVDNKCDNAGLKNAFSDKNSGIEYSKEFNCNKAKETCVCPWIPDPDIVGLIKKVMNWIFGIALAAAVLMVIIGALLIMVSAGQPDKITQGRKIIVWAMIGLAVIASSWLLAEVVKRIFGG